MVLSCCILSLIWGEFYISYMPRFFSYVFLMTSKSCCKAKRWGFCLSFFAKLVLTSVCPNTEGREIILQQRFFCWSQSLHDFVRLGSRSCKHAIQTEKMHVWKALNCTIISLFCVSRTRCSSACVCQHCGKSLNLLIHVQSAVCLYVLAHSSSLSENIQNIRLF